MHRFLTAALTAAALAAAFPSAAQQIVVDNADPGFSTPEGSWFPSANPGFFGSNSLLASTGGAADRAQWTAQLPTQGEYEIEAWWVASGNRATDAPFLINDPGGPSTSVQNQTTNGSQWNSLGNYVFNAGPATVELTDAVSSGDFVSADAVRFTYVGPGTPGTRCVPQETALVTLGAGGNCFGLDLPGFPEPHPDTKYAIHSDLPEAFTGNGVLYTTRDVIPSDPTNLIPLSLRTQTNAGFTTIDDDFDVFIFHISRPGDGSEPRRIVVHVQNNGPDAVTIEPDQVIVTQGVIGNIHEMESNLGSRWMAGQYDTGRPNAVTIPAGAGAVIGWSNNFAGFGAGIDANINCFGLLRADVLSPTATTDLDVSVVAIPSGSTGTIESATAGLLNVAATSQESSINLTTPPAPFELRRAVGVFENFQWRSDPVTIDANTLSGTSKTFAMALSEIQAGSCPAGRQTVPMVLHPGFAHGDTIGNYQVDYRVNLHLVNSSQTEARAFDVEFGRSGADIGLAWRVAAGSSLPSDAATDATPVYTEWAGPFQDDAQLYDSMLEPAGGPITLLPCEEVFVQVRLTVLGNSSLPFQFRVVPATPDPNITAVRDWWILN